MENKKQKILIADDSEMNRAILADMLGDQFEILEAEDGTQVVTTLQQYGVEIALILLDIVMPRMDGFEALAFMNQNHWIEDIPVIMISSENSDSYIERAYELGATDYISRPFDVFVVRRRAINTIMLYAKQKRLMGLVTDQIYEKQKTSSIMINILSCIVEFRNGESGLHVRHIGMITEMLLNCLMRKTDRYQLSRSDISLIETASALHDIGKMAIPDEVLNKPGRFTPEEFKIMQRHTIEGEELLKRMPYPPSEPLLKVARDICRCHHERYDGKGYPDGLKGEEIPISAQVVSIADVYDALTSERVYKKAYSHEKALEMILNNECGTFNPLLLQCLLEIADDMQAELKATAPMGDSQREIRKMAEEVVHHEELTASERTLHLLEAERTKYQFFASMSQEVQFEYSLTPPMLTLSAWGAKHLGIDELIMEPLHNKKFMNIFGRENYIALSEALLATTPEEPVVHYDCLLNLNADPRWYHITARTIWSGKEPPQIQSAIGKAVDIHDEQMHMLDLKRMASHDALTGLIDRASAEKCIHERLRNHSPWKFALVMLDLDGFRAVNGQQGHIYGDQVLKYMADCLRKNIRGGDIAARVGGDEFLLFIEYVNSLPAILERITHALSVEMEQYFISVSMGIATTEMGCTDYEQLFLRADQALRFSKTHGHGQYNFYDDSMKDDTVEEATSHISPIENCNG